MAFAVPPPRPAPFETLTLPMQRPERKRIFPRPVSAPHPGVESADGNGNERLRGVGGQPDERR
jgi:hypothetical protein